MVYIMFRWFQYVKQNVIKKTFYALMETVTAALLYLVFPIIPIYVFIPLLVMVLVASILARYGLSSAILITYVALIFIATLGYASLLVMPLLLFTYLITGAGVINDVALISWALLFTPIYWLSIPLAITPSVKGYGVRAPALFTSLMLLYIVGLSLMGIKWLPITMMPTSGATLIQGIESILTGRQLHIGTAYMELTNTSLYVLSIIVLAIPYAASRYLSGAVTRLALNVDVLGIINNLLPQVLTIASLYVLTILSNSALNPLFLAGAVVAGAAGYALDKALPYIESAGSSVTGRKRVSMNIIPVTDPLGIVELSRKVDELAQDERVIFNEIINVLRQSRIIAVYTDAPLDRLAPLVNALFGVFRIKGFIINGDVVDVPGDVDFYIRSHEKTMLVLIPSSMGEPVLRRLRYYAERGMVYVVIFVSNTGLVSKLGRRGIPILNLITVKTQSQARTIETVSEEIPLSTNAHTAAEVKGEMGGSTQAMNGAQTAAVVVTGQSQLTGQVKPVESKNEQTPQQPKEQIIGKTQGLGKATEIPTVNVVAKKQVKPRSDAKPAEVKRSVNVALDPVDLIDTNIRAKLIDYVDSSVRLRDVLANLGLKYPTTILIIGPPRSGKTALINYVAKHLNLQIINYTDPGIATIDNAVIHVPSLEKALKENPDHVRKLISIARTKHAVAIFESSDPWQIDGGFIEGNIDAVIPILPPDDDYVNEIVSNRLGISGKDADIVKAIIKSCPAVEAIEKIRHYLSSHSALGVLCSDPFSRYREFAKGSAPIAVNNHFRDY